MGEKLADFIRHGGTDVWKELLFSSKQNLDARELLRHLLISHFVTNRRRDSLVWYRNTVGNTQVQCGYQFLSNDRILKTSNQDHICEEGTIPKIKLIMWLVGHQKIQNIDMGKFNKEGFVWSF